MITKLDDLKDGHLYSPAQVAPFLPGGNPRRVREMCADGKLAHITTEGPAGQARYWIDGATVKAWRRLNTVPKKKVA